MSRRPFIPLEVMRHTSKSTSPTANANRWVWPRDARVGGHALLDMRYSTIQHWLSHSETDIKSVGDRWCTLVSARVFRQLAGRREGVFAQLNLQVELAHKGQSLWTACALLAAAGHDPYLPLFVAW